MGQLAPAADLAPPYAAKIIQVYEQNNQVTRNGMYFLSSGYHECLSGLKNAALNEGALCFQLFEI